MALEISIIILHSDVMIQKYTNKTGNNLIVWSITMIKHLRADRVLLKQGSHATWKTWKVMEFGLSFWNFVFGNIGHGKSWNFIGEV